MKRSPSGQSYRYVAIGASGTDGLDDICELLRALPYPLAAVVMVVLHRSVSHISQLRSVLAAATKAKVIVASEGESLVPGCVYIGEPADHLTLIERGTAGLVAGADNEYRNRTVDLLFNSLATIAGPATIGVVLSGALDDGSRGLAAIHSAGGITMVLRRTVGPPGMPENAIHFDGPIDMIGSPMEIALAIEAQLAKALPGR